MLHFFEGDSADPPMSSRERVASLAARTLPWVMGTLAAGFRESAEGLHPAQFRTLMAMHAGAVSPTLLAERMHISPPTMSQTLTALERRGLVARGVDPDDRRRTTIALTDAGRTALSTATRSAREQLARLLDVADDDEIERIEIGLQTLSEVLFRSAAHHHGQHWHHAHDEGNHTR